MHRDWIELLNLFNAGKVRFMIIGGFAVIKYAEPRFTKDIDIWVGVDFENARRVYEALRQFGAPLAGITPEDFTKPGYFYQMGRPPFRVDIVMTIPGIEFEDAWRNRVMTQIESTEVAFISKADLIKAKAAAGRPQDLLDLERLRQSGPTGES
jgi:hypothetical protein